MVIKTMLWRFLHSYLATVHGLAQNILISILSIFQKVPEEMVTLFLYLNIFTQGKLFLLFRRSCPWKTNIFSMFGMEYLLQEGIFAKNCQDLWVYFLILINKFHIMLMEDIVWINTFRKNMVALRESQIDVAAYKSVGCLSKNKEAFHKKHHINKFLQILNMFLCSCIFLDRFSKNSKYAPTWPII